MSTGVVINGYEIRNWHTVSILELARARQGQAQPVPVEKVQKKKPAKRSKDMSKKVEISEEQARAWAIAYERDRASMSSLSRASGVSAYVISRRIDDYLKANPDFATKLDQLKLTKEPDLSTKVDAPDCNTTVLHPGHAAAADVMRQAGFDEGEIKQAIAADVPPTPDEQMDDPESIVAAAANDTRIIQVQELTVTPQRPLRPYTPPAVVFDGALVDLVRPGIVRPANVTAVGQMVQALVEELNTIPGVTAFFDFDYRLTAGVRP